MNSALASSELRYFTGRGSGPPLLLVHGLMVTGERTHPATPSRVSESLRARFGTSPLRERFVPGVTGRQTNP
jgi:hypothetical protein